MRVALMHVMRDRSHVVEELAEEVPPLFPLHRFLAEQQVAGLLDRFLQQEATARRAADVAEAFVRGRAGTVVGIGGRREPAFVDAAAMRAESVEIIGMKPQPPAGMHERARHPAGLEA